MRLFGDRIDGDRGMPVAEIDGDESGRKVEIALAVLVVKMRTLAADDHRGFAPALSDPRGQHVARMRRAGRALDSVFITLMRT